MKVPCKMEARQHAHADQNPPLKKPADTIEKDGIFVMILGLSLLLLFLAALAACAILFSKPAPKPDQIVFGQTQEMDDIAPVELYTQLAREGK